MSYNILSGSVEFVGDQLGLTENLVNTHATQTIAGAKTFTNITASSEGDGTVGLKVNGTLDVDGDLTADGDVSAAQYVKHYGDPDTNLEFGADELTLNAGGQMLFNAQSGGPISINGDGSPGSNGDLDFVVYSNNTSYGMKLDANNKSVVIGWLGNPTFNRSDVLVNITSSYHTGSLLSVGDGKNPILAISGSSDFDTQSARIVITGSVLVGGRHGSTQETAYAGGNIIAEGIITGSQGLRGELLSAGFGLTNTDQSGEKKLQVHAGTGINVSANGVAVDVNGLADVGSVNTSTSNQDFFCVSDYNGGTYVTRKMGVGDLLGNTVGTAANLGTGAQVYKTTTSRELKFRKIQGTSPITVTENTDDISVSLAAIGSVGQILHHAPGGSNSGTPMITVDNSTGTGMMDMGGGTVHLGGIAAEVNVTGALAVKGTNNDLDGDAHTQGDATLFTVSGHTNNNILIVTGSNMVGIGGVTAPQATLDVKGIIAISNEESSTPSQPPDGNGLLYTKTDGKLYWRSYDLGETDLTVGNAGGANGEILYNLSGALEGHGTYKMVTRNTPGQTEVYLTGTMHAQNIEIAQEAEIYEADCQQLTASAAHLNGGVRLYSTAKTANYNLQSQDRIVIFNTNTNVTATLPDIVSANVGQVYTIKNVNAGEVHITGSNPGEEQLIDGIQYLVLSSSAVGNGPYLTVTSYSTGAGYGWAVIARQLSTDSH